MKSSYKKIVHYSLIGIMVAIAAGGMAYLSLLGSELLTSLYGNGSERPDTKEELCLFLENKLAQPEKLSQRAAKRYQSDYDLHCTIDEFANLKEAPEEVDWSQYPYRLKNQNVGGPLRGFLREARSGLDVIFASNNLIDMIRINNPVVEETEK